MVYTDEDFRRWLGHEGRALTNEISNLLKETPESSFALSAMWRYCLNLGFVSH